MLNKYNGGLSTVTSPLFTSNSRKLSLPFTKIIQKDPSDRLNISPYSFLRPRTASKKSPLAKLWKFPITGKAVGPGGKPTGRLNLIHSTIPRMKTKRNTKSKQPKSNVRHDITCSSGLLLKSYFMNSLTTQVFDPEVKLFISLFHNIPSSSKSVHGHTVIRLYTHTVIRLYTHNVIRLYTLQYML